MSIHMQEPEVNPNGNTPDEARDSGGLPAPEWRCPVITRIDIKRTLFGSGTQNDGTTFPQSPLT